MKTGGEVKRGKISKETKSSLILSVIAVLLGICFTLLPNNATPGSSGDYCLRILSIFALIIGSSGFTSFFSQAKRELYPK